MSNQHLKVIVEELEHLAEKKAEIAEEEKAVKAAASAKGYSVKIISTILKLRKMTPSERAEYEGLVDLYKAELGMLDETPLGKAARDRLSRKKGGGAAGDGKAAGDGSAAGDAAARGDAPEPGEAGFEDDAPEDATGPTPEAIETARQEGAQAFRDGADVLDNPHLAGDPRRAAWDEGYYMEAGSDGMDLPDAWKPASAKKPKRDVGAEGDRESPQTKKKTDKKDDDDGGDDVAGKGE